MPLTTSIPPKGNTVSTAETGGQSWPVEMSCWDHRRFDLSGFHRTNCIDYSAYFCGSAEDLWNLFLSLPRPGPSQNCLTSEFKKNSHHIWVFSALWRSRNCVDKCGEAAAGPRNCWLAFSITVMIMIITIIILCFLFLSTRNGTTKNEMFPISWQRFFQSLWCKKKKKTFKVFLCLFRSLSQTFVFWLFSFHHRLSARLNLPVEHRVGVLVLLRLCM